MNKFLVVGLAFGLLMFLGAGCGDDDKSVNKPVVPTEGELTDVRFLFADEVCEPDIMRTTEISLVTSLYFLMGLPTGLSATDAMTPHPALPDDLTGLVINSVNTPTMSVEGWYVFEFDITATYDYTDTVFAVGLDSVRLSMSGSPVAWTGFSTIYDTLEFRDKYAWSNNQADAGVSRHNISLSVVDSLIPSTGLNISVADTIHTSIQDDSGFCYVDLYETATGTGVLISGPQMGFSFCADSGTVAIRTVVELDCTEHSQAGNGGVEGLWIYEGTYNSSHILSGKLTHADTYWVFADTCTL